MAFLTTLAFTVLMTAGGLARSLSHDEPMETVLSGTFYSLNTLTGDTQHRINRRHLGAMNGSSITAMRLDLGPEVAALDMELRQDSVWTEDSVVVVRRGDQVEEIRDAVDSSCFLSGRLTSQGGAASINTCGKMTGLIQTNDFVYEIEEAEDGNLDSGVKVTMKKSEDISSSEDGVVIEKDHLGLEQRRGLGEILTKRQQQPITAEVAVFVDANFARWMARNEGKPTDAALSQWIVRKWNVKEGQGSLTQIHANFARWMARKEGKPTDAALSQWIVRKWNVIRGVYGNAPVVGVPFSIQLKKIEIWRTNPYYYSRIGNRATTETYLRAFCEGTPSSPNYDHKMLYTQGMSRNHHMGMAFLNKICRPTRKCSLCKARFEDVKVEIHEFGHNLGFQHDPEMLPCTDPSGNGGFMGWGSNYNFLDCYRRRLLQTIREPGARCLYERNVNMRTLNA